MKPAAGKIDMVAGKTLFQANCSMCHQANGEGLAGAFPPLAGSDFLNRIANKSRDELVSIVLKGKNGKITVNDKEYNGVMTPVAGLGDEDLATLLSFVTNQWGNKAPFFAVEEIKKLRAAVLGGDAH